MITLYFISLIVFIVLSIISKRTTDEIVPINRSLLEFLFWIFSFAIFLTMSLAFCIVFLP